MTTRIEGALAHKAYAEAAGLAAHFSLDIETIPFQDYQRNKIASLLSWVGARYGEAQLLEAQRHTVAPWFMDGALNRPGERITVDRRLVENFVTLGRTRGFEYFGITEDEDRISIVERSTGGKMIRDGYYDEGSRFEFYRIPTPQPMTYSEPDFDVYNAHIAVGSILHLERSQPLIVTYESSPCWSLDGIALLTLYKRESDIPAHHYEKLGCDKPHAAQKKAVDPPRFFSDEELSSLLEPLEMKLQRVFARERYDLAQRLLTDVNERWTAIRRIYHLWPLALVEWINEMHGPAEADLALERASRLCLEEVGERLMGAEDERGVIEMLAAYWRSAACDFYVHETSSAFDFVLRPGRYSNEQQSIQVSIAKRPFTGLSMAREMFEVFAP